MQPEKVEPRPQSAIIESKHQMITKELCDRFQNKPRRCMKQNDTLIQKNKRIVNVHNQTFAYYHMIQEFDDLDVGKIGSVIPKAAIKIKDIQNLAFPLKSKKDKNHFTITFPKNKILKYGKNNKEIVVNPEAKGLQSWTFFFDYDIVVLPRLQERVREEQKKNQQNLERKQEQQNRRNKYLDEQEAQTILKQRKKQEQFQAMLRENEETKLAQAFNKNEEMERRKLERQSALQQQQIQDEKPLEESFNLEYWKTRTKMPMNQLLKIELSILQVIGNFRVKAIENVKWLTTRILSKKQASKLRIADNEYQLEDMYIKIGQKDINQEFLALSTVADVISVLYRINEQYKMRVPLTAMVKYRGYKCLCTSKLPVDSKLIYGLQKQGIMLINSLVCQKLKMICKELNLKPYQAQLNQMKYLVYLEPGCQVYSSQKQKCQFIANIKQIFPIDVNFQRSIDQRFVRMRPEYVHSICKESLAGGAFLNTIDDPDGEEEDVAVGKTSYILNTQVLAEFVNKLNNLDILLLDSPSITDALQTNGINVRYIGKIAKIAQLPYIRELMHIQAIARAIKHLFRSQVKHYSEQKYRKERKNSTTYNKDQISTQSIHIFDQISKKVVIDFLNLIFGNTKDTLSIWQSFIKPQVKDKYQLDIQVLPSVSYGALLHAVLYHCGVKIKFDINVKLFNIAEPFKEFNWLEYTVSSKVFEYPSFEIQKLARKSKEYIDSEFKDLAIKSLNLELITERALRSSQSYQHCALPEQRILIKLANLIEVKTSNFPIHHPSMLEYILSNVTEENFVKANSIAEFSLPTTHPLFISFYMAYSKIFDKNILFKSSIIVAYRSLGPQHWKTSQLLAEAEDKDIELLKKAWVESGKNNHKILLIVTQKLQFAGKLGQCIQFCQKGLEILGTPREQNFQAIIKILIRAIRVCYHLRSIKYMRKCVGDLWKVLEEFDTKNQNVYCDMIQYTLKVQLESHPHKNYLYKIVLVIADKILTDAYEKEAQQGKKMPYTLKQLKVATTNTDFFPKAANEMRSILLQDVIKSSRESKTHIHWIQSILTQLDMCHNMLNYSSDFFTNFEENARNLYNDDFDQGLQGFQLLTKVFGQEVFYNALMKDIFGPST